MSLATGVRSVLKVLLRTFYVRDCSFLPDKEYIISRNKNGKDSSEYPCYCTSLDGGTVKAQYGMRFMRLPFRDVASVLLNKDLKEVTDADLEALGRQNQEPELLDAGDPEPYVKNYYHYQNLFIDNYKLQKANGRINQETMAAITEEIAHNDLLNDTPSFVIINALSVYYRLCACYLAVRRKERKPVGSTDISVAKAMLNSGFMRSAIFTNIYPVIEASYHYDEDLENVERNYNRQVVTHCNRFKSIKQQLLDQGVSEAWIATIMKTLQKTMLSFPFLYVITQKSGIDYNKFFGNFIGFDVRNAELMDEVEKIIATPSFSVDGLLEYINGQKRLRTTNSKLDTDFLRSLVYLATETKEGFVPKGLVSFVLTHKKCIQFGSVILWKKGLSIFKKKEDKLVGFPSLVSFGLRNERYFVDQQMEMFGKGRSFFMGLKGMEGTLTGKESKDKAEVESYNRLIVQSFFVKAVYAVGRKNVLFEDFSSMFDICFEIRPFIKDVQVQIQGTILKEFYSKAEEIGYLLPDPVTDEVASSFQKRSEQLYDYIESLPQEDLREKFYLFCDINYLHGF